MSLNYLSSILAALVLCASSGGLIVWHIRTWRRLQRADLDPRERDFRSRQYRRRMQISVMLGILGVAILIGQLLILLIAWQVWWKLVVFYWIGVLLFVLWMAILAVADMAATGFYFGREKTASVIEHAKLQDELRRAREKAAKNSNGKPK